MNRKITLPLPVRLSQDGQHKPVLTLVKSVSEMQVTPDQRRQMLDALNVLGSSYGLNFTKLMRRLGETTEVKTFVTIRKDLPVSRFESLAAHLGLSLSELFAIKKLPLYRVEQLRKLLSESDLLRK